MDMDYDEFDEIRKEIGGLIDMVDEITDKDRLVTGIEFAIEFRRNMIIIDRLLITYSTALLTLDWLLEKTNDEKEEFDHKKAYKNLSYQTKKHLEMFLKDNCNYDYYMNKILNKRIEICERIIEWMDNPRNKLW